MRSIGKLSSEKDALRFSAYLKKRKIAHSCDAAFETPSQYIGYEVWVHDEDHLEEAKAALAKFLQNPEDPEFDSPLEEAPVQEIVSEEEVIEERPLEKRLPCILTKFIIILCSIVFLLSAMQERALLREKASYEMLAFTPFEMSCLYDVPPFFEEFTKLLQKYKPAPNQKLETLPPDVQAEFEQLRYQNYWRGLYDWILLKIKTGDTSEAEGPLFAKIRQGEIWRLVSPSIIHGGFLHILFNMLWVWILCKPIEQRLGFFRTLLFTLIVAIGSNTIQYLAGGPFFLGYSGVVMGLAGFIWSRQKLFPWEGYPIQRSTLLFLIFFVLAMFGLQFTSFILQTFSNVQFSPNIANTAHIAGGLIGASLGRLRFFSWRASR